MMTPEEFVDHIMNEMETIFSDIASYRKKFLGDIGDNQELLFSYLNFERDFLIEMSIKKAKQYFTEADLGYPDVEKILDFERECLQLIPQKVQNKFHQFIIKNV